MTDAEKAALIAQYEDEIAEITTAMSAIRKGGQEYTIDTGSSIRKVSMADYETLKIERNELYAKIQELEGDAGITLTAGW